MYRSIYFEDINALYNYLNNALEINSEVIYENEEFKLYAYEITSQGENQGKIYVGVIFNDTQFLGHLLINPDELDKLFGY